MKRTDSKKVNSHLLKFKAGECIEQKKWQIIVDRTLLLFQVFKVLINSHDFLTIDKVIIDR